MRRTKLIALIFGLLIFALGLVTGVLAHRLYVADSVNASEDWRVRYVRELHSKLKLSDHQVDKLNDILDNTRAKVRAVKDRYKPEMLTIKQDQIARVVSILSPQQADQYRKIVAEQEVQARQKDAMDKKLEQQRAIERHNREQQPSH
jgi:hypothetical protein